MGSPNDHPSPVELKNRLKWYILGKHSEYALSANANAESDSSSVPFIHLEDISDLAENDVDEEAVLFRLNDSEKTFEVEEQEKEMGEEENDEEKRMKGLKYL